MTVSSFITKNKEAMDSMDDDQKKEFISKAAEDFGLTETLDKRDPLNAAGWVGLTLGSVIKSLKSGSNWQQQRSIHPDFDLLGLDL